jgi:type II secretory pathway component PulF
MRRIAAQTAAYPLLVIVLAVVMLVGVASAVLPGYEWLELGSRVWVAPLGLSSGAAKALAIALPIAAALAAAVWWRRSASAIGTADRRQWTRWIPGAQQTARLSGQASFADMLGLLVACRAPLVEALPLAASASGSDDLQSAAAKLSSQLAAGQPLTSRLDAVRGLPPLVRTALLASPGDGAMTAGLNQAAEIYRERANSSISRLALLAPIIATLAVGGVVIFAYALLLFQPYVAVLEETASW